MKRKTPPKFYDFDKDLIQCQLCNEWFKTLNSHLSRIHECSGEEYKEKFGLWNGDLISIDTREKMSKNAKNRITPELLKQFKKNVASIPQFKKKPTNKRFKALRNKSNFLHTPEVKQKIQESLKKYRKTKRYVIDRERAAEKIRKGRYQFCKICKTKYWVKRCAFEKSICCTRKCLTIYRRKENI